MPVHFGGIFVVFIAQFHIGNLFSRSTLPPGSDLMTNSPNSSAPDKRPRYFIVFIGGGMIGTEGAGGGLDVLSCEYGGYVIGDKPVLRHLVGTAKVACCSWNRTSVPFPRR